eukprot:NODE_42_length_29671_cov_0.584810.p20 type:complete len:112 gc:universal NODE_42_length_29671_cov_0.584810:13455-13790(+)
MENDYTTAMVILNITRYKEFNSRHVDGDIETEMATRSQGHFRSKQDLLKKVLTRKCLQSIQKQYPITFTVTMYPQSNKDLILDIVKNNKILACVEMREIYNLDISEFVSKI